ncbi:MAG: hypothetical protein ACRDIC_12960, partial [bacterium]
MTPEIGALLGILGAAFAVLLVRWAYLKGWEPLRSRFPATTDNASEELTFRSLSIRLPFFVHLNFGFSTAVKLTNQSIQIRVFPPFGALFKPINLPWSAIENVELRRSLFGYRVSTVKVKDYSGVLLFYFQLAQLVHDKWLREKGLQTPNNR